MIPEIIFTECEIQSKSEHSQLEYSDIIPETMNEVEKVDKVLGFSRHKPRTGPTGRRTKWSVDLCWRRPSRFSELKTLIKIFTKIQLMVSF